MIEDALREAFAAKAGTRPPTSLDGIADVAIRNAGRIRRRRRTAVTGFAVFIVMAVASVATFHVITTAGPAGAPARQTRPTSVPARPSCGSTCRPSVRTGVAALRSMGITLPFRASAAAPGCRAADADVVVVGAVA